MGDREWGNEWVFNEFNEGGFAAPGAFRQVLAVSPTVSCR